MAITAASRPLLIVAGSIESSTNRFAFDRETRRRTTEVIGYTAIVQPTEGAAIEVRYGIEDGPVRSGDMVAIYVSVQESREYGVFLNFERHLTGDDLEAISRDALQSAKAA